MSDVISMNVESALCLDVVVLGKALRDWKVDDTGDTLEDMFAWKHAVKTALPCQGHSLAEVVGAEFADAFEDRYREMVREEQERQADVVFIEGAARLGYEGAKVVYRFIIPHGSWVPDHQYAIMEINEGRRVALGTLKGKWTIFDESHLVDGIARLKRQQDFAYNALQLLHVGSSNAHEIEEREAAPVETARGIRMTAEDLLKSMQLNKRWRPATWEGNGLFNGAHCYVKYGETFVEYMPRFLPGRESPALAGIQDAMRKYGNVWRCLDDHQGFADLT